MEWCITHTRGGGAESARKCWYLSTTVEYIVEIALMLLVLSLAKQCVN